MALRPEPRRLNGAAASEASDESLALQAAALADLAAFEVLVRRHERRVLYLHRRFTRNAALAEELAQETFLRAWQKLHGFKGRGRFGSWLTRLAYHVFLRNRQRDRHHDETASLDDLTVSEADQALARAGSAGDVEPDLERLLAVVSAEEQQLLVLAYAGGLSAGEIGEMLGTPAGTVKSQIHRAKDKIRRHFHIEANP